MKVCFVAPYTYPLFDPACANPFGGIEVQSHLLAITLAKRPGFDVSFVVFDHGQPDGRVVDGVRLLKYRLPKENISQNSFDTLKLVRPLVGNPSGRVAAMENLPLTRPIYHAAMTIQAAIDRVNGWRRSIGLMVEWARQHRLIERWRNPYYQFPHRVATYRQAKADIFVGFGASELSAELAAFCRTSRTPLILFGASDSDFDAAYRPDSDNRNRYGCRHRHCYFSMASAKIVVAQNQHQRDAALTLYRQQAPIILNPLDLTTQAEPLASHDERNGVFWVGKADWIKQPLLIYKIARALPTVPFRMVVNPNQEDVLHRLVNERPPNVTLESSIAREDVPKAMADTTLLVNSSAFEGFPNTFLEAFRAGTPVVSLNADPNGVLEHHGCGACCHSDISAMTSQIKRLLTDRHAWKTASANARRYAETHHSAEVVTDQLEAMLRKTVFCRTL